MEASVRSRIFRADITEKVTFETRPEGERASHVSGEECSGKGTASARAPRNSVETSVRVAEEGREGEEAVRSGRAL